MMLKKLTAALAMLTLVFAVAATPLSERIAEFLSKPVFSAEASSDTSEAVKLPDNAVSFSNSTSKFKAVALPQNGGLYYFNNNAVNFYDVANNTVTTLQSFSNVVDVYANSSKLFILRYTYSSYKYTFYLDTYNALTESLESTKDLSAFVSANSSLAALAIGVDNSGRYYLATYDSSKEENNYTIHLISADWTELSSVDVDYRIYRFSGFDETNGNFYFEGYLNWIYWGYDHDTTSLKCGNVNNNTISVSDLYVDILYQNGYTPHYDSAAMLNGNYFAWTSTLNGVVRILKSNEFSLSDTSLPLLGSVSRAGYENSYYESAGTRVVYNSINDSIIMYVNNNMLVEFNSEFEQQSSYYTQYPVFALINYGNNIIAIERDTDSNYYIENIAWKLPEKVTLSQTSASIKTGENIAVSASCDSSVDYGYTWSSSDYSVASVTESGVIYGNKAGTATITAAACNGVKATCKVTVTENPALVSADTSVVTSGASSNNISDNNYSTHSSVAYSNLYQNDDGTLARVEKTASGVLVETYSSDGKTLISTKTIKNELELFGGFFSGEDHNYLVFGQMNTAESDETEVVRVVKYTKAWSKVSECNIYGSNTYIPFDAGSLRMTELDGKLNVYTCHEMYAAEDEPDLHHQANMLFTIDESTMQLTDSMYNVSNLSNGYVSHSFNQFIRTDGTYIYRVDHSEGYNLMIGSSYISATGITLTRYYKDNSSTAVSVSVPLYFDIHNGNYTGASIGGFELGENSCIIAYNKDISSSVSNRNIYIIISDKLFNSSKEIALTNYTSLDNITCFTPQLVKVNENLFLVMWEEYNNTTGKITGKIMTIDANGNTVSEATNSFLRLSDCQPILCADGNVKWYVTNNGAPTLYSVNPYDIMSMHVHTYQSKITKSATCISTGTRTYTCSCGDSYTQTIAKTDHTYVSKTVAATYAAQGYTLHTCSVCGDSYKDNYTAKKTVPTVTMTTFTCTSSAVRINWNKVTGATGYRVYRYNSATNKWDTIATITDANTLTYRQAGLASATQYQYKVQAYVTYNGVNYWGTSSAALTTTTKPAATKITSFTNSTTAIRINWNKVAGATGYRIYRYNTATKKWDIVTTITNANTLTYRQAGLAAGTQYQYKVTAYVKLNGVVYWGAASSVLTATTNPATVKMTTYTATSSAVRINWNKVTGATGYRVYRYNTSTKKWETVATIANSSIQTYRQPGLKAGTTYKYKVKAYIKLNGVVYWGAASPTFTTKTKS